MLAFRSGALSRPFCVSICVLAAALALSLTPAPLAAQAVPDAKTVAGPERIGIAFIGDSMADGLWGGVTRLTAHDHCHKDVLDLGRFARNGSGLTRPEQFSWVREARKIVGEFKPHLFVVSIGLNDRQSIIDRSRGLRANYKTPEWSDRYRDQIAEVLRSATAEKAAVLWVGLPAMRDTATQEDAQEKNRLFAEAIGKFGDGNVQYVEPWRLNPSGPDVFASYGPDKNGNMIQLRMPDGIHFTIAGYDMVAAYLFPKIVTSLRANGRDIEAACAK